MKRFSKSILLVALFGAMTVPAWGQATPSTEGQDFWVTFLRADADNPEELKLTISAREACTVVIENPTTGFKKTINVQATNLCPEEIMSKTDCYSSNSNNLTYTALHVTSDKDISLFAGNYRNKSFDAANILPTSALLDDYLIQTYPASDHDDANKAQGSHFAIVAVEDGETVVDYTLTATATVPGKSNTGNFVTLKKGQVCYVWTGVSRDDPSDLSGSSVKARDGKKIAVFQGCPHTNVPDRVRNRDHIFSQAMPIAYWGNEFCVTSSLLRRRDIVAVMAINDGTEVYINAKDGEPQLVHTFDFSQDKKHYWTFEIGEEIAYCNGSEAPSYGKLKSPTVIDSSCYITTSCPAGIHLIMPSNRYDLPEQSTPEPDSDPALLWISPIEQVIKDINFATYNKGINTHYVNIVTSTSDIANVTLDGTSIASAFYPVRGNSDYSYARIIINEGSHNLHSTLGFCAHVYGYGDKASYAYSCGSSTVTRSITFNGTPLEIDSVYSGQFCVDKEIEMKLNIGNNNYTSVKWDFGDGTSYSPDPNAPNKEKRVASHAYSIPGWYDLQVSASYINSCTGKKHDETMGFSFRVVAAKTIYKTPTHECKPEDYDGPMEDIREEEFGECDSIVITPILYGRESSYEYTQKAEDYAIINDSMYTNSTDVKWDIMNNERCPHHITCHLEIVKCLDLAIVNIPEEQHVCLGASYDLPYSYDRDGKAGRAWLVRTADGKEYELSTAGTSIEDARRVGTLTLPIEEWAPGRYKAKVRMEDVNCETIAESPELDIAIYYTDSIFKPKFNNTLAIYAPGNGGNFGYDLRGFQWYRNGQAILDATNAVYTSDVPFTPGDIYHVELTNGNGVTLPSCGWTVPGNVTDNASNQAPKAEKRLVNQRIRIIIDDRAYDVYGQRVE